MRLPKTLLLTGLGSILTSISYAQSIDVFPFVAYTQNFDGTTQADNTTLAFATGLPAGWAANETLANANTLLRFHNGGVNTGDTYLFGSTGSTERALGSIQSGSLLSTFGASFTNASVYTFSSLVISYTGEQWRNGAVSRNDGFDFQYSTSATSLTTGTWLDWNPLDYQTISGLTPDVATNGNVLTTSLSSTITGLTLAPASVLWIRWVDINGTGTDDGRAVDSFSFTPVPEPSTYAALAGLAVLGLAALRRRKA